MHASQTKFFMQLLFAKPYFKIFFVYMWDTVMLQDYAVWALAARTNGSAVELISCCRSGLNLGISFFKIISEGQVEFSF